MRNYLILSVLILAIGFAGYQLYRVAKNYRNLLVESYAIKSEAEVLKKENINLQARVDSLADPENLIQEIKRQFNFRRPGERTIIVAPER